MSVRISWRMTTAMIGPTMPPRPPARLTPPRTTAATPGACTGRASGRRCWCWPRAPGRRAPRTAPSARRPRSSSARRRRRSGTPRAGCCRSRRSTGRGASERSGIQITATMTARTTIAFGMHSRRRPGPRTSSRSHATALPPGRVEHEQREARPHERHRQRDDDVGHAGDHDHRAVDGAEEQPEQEDRGDDEQAALGRRPFICEAATTSTSAIIGPPTGRSRPRSRRWPGPTVASASGRTAIARPWRPGTP